MKMLLAGSLLAACFALSPLFPGKAYGLQAPATVEQDLKTANEERDRELAELSKETDRQKFEARKAEILKRYAQISEAIRKQAEASGKVPPTTTTKPAPTPRPKKTVAQKFYNTGRPAKTRGATVDVAALQAKLDDENARHDKRLAELNRQLKAAEASAKKNEVRKLQSAISKENSKYEATKADLERRITEAGGTVAKSPAAASARKRR